jgi:hypothetical protein
VSEVRWGGESSASGTRGVYDQSHVPVERIAWTGSGNSRLLQVAGQINPRPGTLPSKNGAIRSRGCLSLRAAINGAVELAAPVQLKATRLMSRPKQYHGLDGGNRDLCSDPEDASVHGSSDSDFQETVLPI